MDLQLLMRLSRLASSAVRMKLMPMKLLTLSLQLKSDSLRGMYKSINSQLRWLSSWTQVQARRLQWRWMGPTTSQPTGGSPWGRCAPASACWPRVPGPSSACPTSSGLLMLMMPSIAPSYKRCVHKIHMLASCSPRLFELLTILMANA